MDKCREQFEEWFNSVAKNAVLADTIKDDNGNYYFAETRLLWQAWQASRQALVVSLPDASNDGEESLMLVVYKELEEHGISYK